MSSRYRPDAAPDYGHRFHAGNVGDVWKHCVLVEVLHRAAAASAPAAVRYVETHAGEGGYALGATGEWTEGIGRLWSRAADDDGALGRYVAICRALGAGDARPERYPGSPRFARHVLGSAAPLALWERDAAAAARLAAALAGDPAVRITEGDGLAALDAAVHDAEREAGAVVVLVDPPWGQKADWTVVPDVLARAVRASTRACLLLWYPVKSLTRPNAMIARLAAAGVGGTIAELVTTPLAHRRQRLNGSGVLLVRPPEGALAAIAAAAPAVGAACATRDATWSLRVQAWSEGAPTGDR